MDEKFVVCKHCGNMAKMVKSSGVAMQCCGEEMSELTVNTVDASHEKHIPVVTVVGDEVIARVGSVDHPMIEEHSILWIYLQTENGGQTKFLKPGDAPEARFTLNKDVPVAVYAYCNLHGLWKTEL